ncbi:LytR C-terminal domain-containing protein [Arcanobacterium bovis]|uniref:LytR family transcriptional regulator n=1 Tax=Arcanobacterium bovis TaxID=2529275 RepID=A0A4Q9V2I0_9ACTO|nr:LytR C-terminal domain-containing protein [Arcanobacterium bovis]TBW23820.1 LytR family transcriptional regulator [Arcanobacterium bovis]
MAENYPEDEFDRLAQERETHGAHRVPRKNRGWWIALIAVLVFAPLVGIGAGQLYASTRSSSSESTSSSASTSDSSTSDASKDRASNSDKSGTDAQKDSATSSDSGAAANSGNSANPPAQQAAPVTPAAPATPQPNMAAKIQVLNGKGTKGYAASQAKILTDGGYSSVAADNYTKSTPRTATVYFADDSLEVTAKDVAAKLGISQVLKAPEAVKAPNQIVVVLR